jgi:hypothetical protein
LKLYVDIGAIWRIVDDIGLRPCDLHSLHWQASLGQDALDRLFIGFKASRTGDGNQSCRDEASYENTTQE